MNMLKKTIAMVLMLSMLLSSVGSLSFSGEASEGELLVKSKEFYTEKEKATPQERRAYDTFSAPYDPTLKPVANDNPLKGTSLYGYRVYDDVETGNNGIAQFDSENPTGLEVICRQNGLAPYSAGEYYDGYIYAYDMYGWFSKTDPNTYERTIITYNTPGAMEILDMAYDYSTGSMYAIAASSLVKINLFTGAGRRVASLGENVKALACGNDGTIYVITDSGMLCKYNSTTKRLDDIVHTGIDNVYYIQSMTYDHENNCLYWATMTQNAAANLVKIDPVTCSVENLGTMGMGDEIAALHIPYSPSQGNLSDRLHGYRIFSPSMVDIYGHVSINTTDGTDIEYLYYDLDGYRDIYAGEYFNGKIYAFDNSFTFFSMDSETWEREYIGEPSTYRILDMAYDYSTGDMFAVAVKEESAISKSYLAKVDIITGSVDILAQIEQEPDDTTLALACSTDGHLYCVGTDGLFVELNKTNATKTVIGHTGLNSIKYVQSMAFDHNTGILYWASYEEKSSGKFCTIDPQTGVATVIDVLGNNSELTMLHAPYASELVPVTGINFDSDEVSVPLSRSVRLNYSFMPENASIHSVTFESSDESTVYVDDFGFVTGMKKGTATITVTYYDGSYTDTIEVTVTEAQGLEPNDLLYAYISYDPQLAPGYYSMKKNSGGNPDLLNDSPLNIFAAEYLNGIIYAFGDLSEPYFPEYKFYMIDALTFELISERPVDMCAYECTYDYSTSTMYAIGIDSAQKSGLYTVNLTNGEMTLVGELRNHIFTLACTSTGDLYGINQFGDFVSVDKTSGAAFEIGATGFQPSYVQSMTFDHSTGNMYWAYFSSEGDSGLMSVDIETGAATRLGTIGSGAEATGLFAIPGEVVVGPEVEVTGITINQDVVEVKVGISAYAEYSIIPQNATNKRVQFTSNDTSIATVNDSGRIVGVSEGTTTINVITVDGGFTGQITVNVTPVYRDGLMYGFKLYGDGDGYMSFMSFPVEDQSNPTYYTREPSMINAGDYIDGLLYFYDGYGDFYVSNTVNWERAKLGTCGKFLVDASYDYSTSTLYASDGKMLYRSNLENGELTLVTRLSMDIIAFAITTEGGIYGITTFGEFVSIDRENGSMTRIAEYFCALQYMQSMTYDHYNDIMYWASCGYDPDSPILFSVDLQTGELTEVSRRLELSCLFMITGENPPAVHTVRFLDYDGTLLKSQMVNDGDAATAPEDPTREGYLFDGWSEDFSCVTSDMDIYATYVLAYETGDVNMDGVVNTGDAVCILRYAVGMMELDETQLSLSDLNGDGRVDSGDATVILMRCVGLL